MDLITKKHSSIEINQIFKKILKKRYSTRWEFLKSHHQDIYEIDYQWFFKNQIDPQIIYS